MTLRQQLLALLDRRLAELGVDGDSSIAGLVINADIRGGLVRKLTIMPEHRYGGALPTVPDVPRPPSLAVHRVDTRR